MKNKFCQTFINGYPLAINDSRYTFGHKSGPNLNFSAEFWQPFIDVDNKNDTTNICGPLLGITFEIAVKLDFNLVYRKTDSGEHSENFEMIGRQLTNLILCPFPPINAVFNGTKFIQLSRCIDDMAMVNILSSKTRVQLLFHLLEGFDIKIWITLIVFYILISFLSTFLNRDSMAFVDYFGTIFGQMIYHWKRKEKTSIVTMIWMIGSLIIMWAYSGILLTFLVFPTPYDKIDSIEELAKRQIDFGVFDDETAFDYVRDPNGPYFEDFKYRYHAEKAGNAGKEQWEQRVFDNISAGDYALVSDQPFNDYYFATKLKKYKNLYQSKTNQIILPYFIALSKFNSKEMNSAIDSVICSLTESGIYEKWVRNTLDENNDAVREGLVDLEQKDCEYTQIKLIKFKGLFFLELIAIISSFIAFTLELILKSKFKFDKHLDVVSTTIKSIISDKRRHKHLTKKQHQMIAKQWIYRSLRSNFNSNINIRLRHLS